MSSARLGEIAKTLNADIARGRIPGAVVAIARRGKLVYFEAFGYRDKAAGVPMTTDTIFNIASMTKPMTAVAALQLYEQGRLLMDDPVAKYFPKFADMKVAVLDAKGESIVATVPAARKITIQDLYRHTSGLIYGGRGSDGGAQALSSRQRPGRRSAERRGIPRQARRAAAAAPARRGVGLRLRSRRARARGRAAQRANARRLPAGQRAQAARHGRHPLPHSGRQGCSATPRRCRTIPTPASRNR